MASKRRKGILSDDTLCHREGQPICSQPIVLSLSDVLQEVPHLLDLMPPKSLAALLAVSQTHRRQIAHEHVRCIGLPGQEHIQTLVQGTWPSLIVWHLDGSWQAVRARSNWYIEDVSMCSMSSASTSLLAKGHMRRIPYVVLSEGFNWAGLSSAAIQGFCAVRWPILTRLSLRFSHINAAAIARIGAASWPCLQELNLSCTGLTYKAFQQLCIFSSSSSNNSSNSRRWPALTYLNVSANNLCHGSLSLAAQPSGVSTDMTGWTCQLKRLDLSHNSLTASAMEQLSQMHWPCLEDLGLQYTSIDVNFMTCLFNGQAGRWPRLQAVDLRGVAMECMALHVLVKAPGRHRSWVRLTVSLQDIAVLELWSSIWMDEQELRDVQLQAAQDPVMHLDVDLVFHQSHQYHAFLTQGRRQGRQSKFILIHSLNL